MQRRCWALGPSSVFCWLLGAACSAGHGALPLALGIGLPWVRDQQGLQITPAEAWGQLGARCAHLQEETWHINALSLHHHHSHVCDILVTILTPLEPRQHPAVPAKHLINITSPSYLLCRLSYSSAWQAGGNARAAEHPQDAPQQPAAHMFLQDAVL